MCINEFLCAYTKKAREDDPLRLSLKWKNKYQFVCRHLLSSVETGGTPYIDHPEADCRIHIWCSFITKNSKIFSRSYSQSPYRLRDNCIIVFGDFYANFQNRTMSKNAKPKTCAAFPQISIFEKAMWTNWSPEFSNYKMIFYTHPLPALIKKS